MPITVNSPSWRKQSKVRGSIASGVAPEGLPDMFVPPGADVSEEVTLEVPPAVRGGPTPEPLDLSTDLQPDQAAILAVRHPSGALTFHRPIESKTTRGAGGSTQVRFQVTVRGAAAGSATRGLVTRLVKAVVVKVARIPVDKLVGLVLPKLVELFEKQVWKKRGLQEGWLRVTPETLKSGKFEPGVPASQQRSLLFIHGTFSDVCAGYSALADTTFFTRVKDLYDDRIFAFNHFSLSKTPEENARALVDGLQAQTTFDVITHSRGGLVLRNLVERSSALGPNATRFKLGHAVLVASPNEGTPLATPERWDEVVGWFANIIEMFPENPFTTGADFVASAIEWAANHILGHVPGLQAMDGRGDMIEELQSPPGPADDAYSALVANYNPDERILARLVDAGVDSFFSGANDLVVPSSGGWQVDRGTKLFIPGKRIGCFGPGGNLPDHGVTHSSFFERTETADFLVTAFEGRPHALADVDPQKALPDRRVTRGRVTATRSAAAARSAATARPSVPPRPEDEERLIVEVHNGDLQFESRPLLLGHYPSARLMSTEKLMNGLVGGVMHRALKAGVYPVAIGSHQVFLNTHVDATRGTLIPRPEAVIVAGLGPEGSLKSANLIQTIRQAVIGAAFRLADPGSPYAEKAHFELAATLVGSGGTGVSPGLSARAIVQGVWEANETLKKSEPGKPPWPRCKSVRLVELYLDRATEAWRSIRQQQQVAADKFVLNGVVFNGRGALVRPSDHGYRGAGYDFIAVGTSRENNQDLLSYTLDSRRARSEVRAVQPQSLLVRELVKSASNDQQSDSRIGHTLFNLLIPLELEADMGGTGALQIELDDTVADIPWELLDVSRAENPDDRAEEPFAIRMKLIRKFRTATFRENVSDTNADNHVLVLGEPACPPQYARLDGARAEAMAVRDRFVAAIPSLPDGEEPVRLLAPESGAVPGPNAQAVLNTLFERAWRIVHIAGHGEPKCADHGGGVVLSSEKTFLGAAEIKGMRAVPELVFVNCCHLGSGTGSTVLGKPYNRAEFASGVARQLIDIGVKCVVAAGWAVEDGPAKEFADTFYRRLLDGVPFIDAVCDARRAAYNANPSGNTWAAYQCYGDPDWRFERARTDPNAWSPNPEDYQVASLWGLKLELDRIAVQAGFAGADAASMLREVRAYEAHLNPAWRNFGDVAFGFGVAYLETGALEDAVRWLQAAADAPDARSPIRAIEQLANAQSRLAWSLVDKALEEGADHRRPDSAGEGSKKARGKTRKAPRSRRAGANPALEDALNEANALLAEANKRLQRFHDTQPTMERESLLGSMHKRRVLIARATDPGADISQDLVGMRDAYRRAVRLGKQEGSDALSYPAINCLAADLAIRLAPGKASGKSATGKPGLDPEILKVLNASLPDHKDARADFWSVVTAIERDQYEAMSKAELKPQFEALRHRYADLELRAKSVRMWSSVYDNARLVLELYGHASTSTGERDAARKILNLIRSFPHPETRQ